MPTKVFRIIIHATLLYAFFSGCSTVYQVKPEKLNNMVVGKELSGDSLAELLIAPYRSPLETSMKELVGRSDAPALKGLPESTLGNLIADLFKEGAQDTYERTVDAVFLNTGGLRVEWPAGNITRAMVFELMPFENMAEVVVMKGSSLRLLLDQIAARGGAPVAGLKFDIAGNRATNIYIGGEVLHDEQTYSLASTDYLLNNGDKYDMPEFEQRIALNIKLRDLLFIVLKKKQEAGISLHPEKDGRIYQSVQ
jgi:2',3'-cyclic-nucleotide 2'-phosphodiesterase (5'-nucleotidase family)